MNWRATTLLICMNIIALPAYDVDPKIKNLLRIFKRRHPQDPLFLDDPGNLPRAARIMPGYTLIKPKLDSLKSAVKFPNPDQGNLVYGNLNNLGMTYGKTNERLMYSGFRRTTQRLLESTILQAIRNIQNSNQDDMRDVIVIEIDTHKKQSNLTKPLQETVTRTEKERSKEENDASEILDVLSPSSSEEGNANYRRVVRRHKYRDRSKQYHRSDSTDTETDEESSSSSSSASDYEKNPGNPFTVHKEKYLQNYLWKHDMDGDHMNVNPWAPQLNFPGPSGPDLFLGRKWWYFNQDDYRPLR